MATTLSPLQAAFIADKVYDTHQAKSSSEINTTGLGNKEDKNSNGVPGLFDMKGAKLLSGRAGYGITRESSGFGIISESNKKGCNETLVAIRGTDGLADVATDLFTSIEQGSTGSGIHAGFSDTYNSFSGALDERFGRGSKLSDCVHVVGHSLGGALATIAATRIAERGHKVKLYTFGSPRVGLGMFTLQATKKIGPSNIYRVHQDADPVTMAPLFPFLHVPVAGVHYRLDWKSGIVDGFAHKMGNYIGGIGSGGHSWSALASFKAHGSGVASIEAWLENAAKISTVIFPMQTRVLALVGQAINWMIQAAGGFAIIEAAGADYVGDKLAYLLMKAAGVAKSMGIMLKNLMIVIMKLLGRALVSSVDMTTAFIRWVLDLLMMEIRIMGLRALSLPRVKV